MPFATASACRQQSIGELRLELGDPRPMLHQPDATASRAAATSSSSPTTSESGTIQRGSLILPPESYPETSEIALA